MSRFGEAFSGFLWSSSDTQWLEARVGCRNLYPILVRGITKGEDQRLHGEEGDNCRTGSNVGGVGTLWPEDTGTGLVHPIANFPSKIRRAWGHRN